MRLRSLSLLLMLASPLAALAQGLLTMTDAEQAALPEGARQEFTQAVEVLGQRQYDAGFEHLQRAAELAPDHARLQFILGEISTNMARQQRPANSERFLAAAREAYQRIAASPSATDAQRAQAQELLSRLSGVGQSIEQRATAEQRRAALQAQGQQILQQAAVSAEAERQAAQALAERRAGEAEQQRRDALRQRRERAQSETTESNRSYRAINDARRLRDQSQNPQ